jgi:hypothetical protein
MATAISLLSSVLLLIIDAMLSRLADDKLLRQAVLGGLTGVELWVDMEMMGVAVPIFVSRQGVRRGRYQQLGWRALEGKKRVVKRTNLEGALLNTWVQDQLLFAQELNEPTFVQVQKAEPHWRTLRAENELFCKGAERFRFVRNLVMSEVDLFYRAKFEILAMQAEKQGVDEEELHAVLMAGAMEKVWRIRCTGGEIIITKYI